MKEFIESIEVDGHLTVGVTEDLTIAIEGHNGGVRARVVVLNTERLRSALFDMSVAQSEHIYKRDRDARASEPIDQSTRAALFASLTEVYGKLSDDERLEKVSMLAGRNIWSMSRRGNMTMADASRVLDILSTFRK